MRKTEYIRKLTDLTLLLSLKRFCRRRSGGSPYSISVNTQKDDLHYEKAQRELLWSSRKFRQFIVF